MAAAGCSDGDARLPSSLDAAKITSLPATAYYLPDFISEEEERMILDKVRPSPRLVLSNPALDLLITSPPPRSLQIATAPRPRWKQLTHRRLQTWPSDLVQDRLLDAPLPPWLETPVVSRLLSLPLSDNDDGDAVRHIFADSPHQRPNHVLINEYPPGIGIMPHKLSTL